MALNRRQELMFGGIIIGVSGVTLILGETLTSDIWEAIPFVGDLFAFKYLRWMLGIAGLFGCYFILKGNSR